MKPQKPPELLHAPHWKPGDGRVPYHYANKPAGSRCLWAVRWIVRFDGNDPQYSQKKVHCVELREWEVMGWALEDMTDEQLRCELEDLSARHIEFAPMATRLLLDHFEDQGYWRSQAEELLRQARQGYPEAIAPWAEPTVPLHSRIYRPGWTEWEGQAPAPVIGLPSEKKRR